jgi:hypothetical protein
VTVNPGVRLGTQPLFEGEPRGSFGFGFGFGFCAPGMCCPSFGVPPRVRLNTLWSARRVEYVSPDPSLTWFAQVSSMHKAVCNTAVVVVAGRQRSPVGS